MSVEEVFSLINLITFGKNGSLERLEKLTVRLQLKKNCWKSLQTFFAPESEESSTESSNDKKIFRSSNNPVNV